VVLCTTVEPLFTSLVVEVHPHAGREHEDDLGQHCCTKSLQRFLPQCRRCPSTGAKRFHEKLHATSGAGTNLKMAAPVRSESGGGVVPLHFLALKAQLVVLVSVYVMVSTVWSVSCLLFYSRCPRAHPFVKVGARAPRPPWSRRHSTLRPLWIGL